MIPAAYTRPMPRGEALALKAGLLAHAQAAPFLLLESNAAAGSGLEWLVAWGLKEQAGAPGADLTGWEDFLARHRSGWSAGILGYDLYKGLHAAGGRAALQNNDALYWWAPENVVGYAGGELRISGTWQLKDRPAISADTGHRAIQLECRVTREEYLDTVHRLLWHIHRGDIYEINYCIEFAGHCAAPDILPLWQRLMQVSPNPFSALLHTPEHLVFSASPERFLRKKGNELFAYPMKGTRARGTNSTEDDQLKEELKNDPKERSENIMIVDLVRNDLSRVALPASVKVEELCEVYTFARMHQMISTVRCTLPQDMSPAAIVRNTFPMGSMTGAPKVKAIELIRQYEKRSRGWFSGSIGYIDPEGNMDLSVVIRSLIYEKKTGQLSLSVGSAITAKSDPEKEYEECLLKAAPVLQALSGNM